MYKFLRSAHKIAGLVGSLFLVLIAMTGFVLALKAKSESIRPSTRRGTEVSSPAEIVHPSVAYEAAFAVGLPELRSPDDVDRFELHAGRNVYKVLSNDGYHEVQVDAGTGKVLAVGRRNDQMMEDIHDMSFFHPALRETLLPVVGAILFLLGVSGVVMYFVPVVRRARHRRQARAG
jgi:uncharacterized iron-regulated membrane protein